MGKRSINQKRCYLDRRAFNKVELSPDMKAAITEVVEETIQKALQTGGLLYRS